MKGIALALGLTALMCAWASADYMEDPKWSQKPDLSEYGFDFSSETLVPSAVADDWRCTETDYLRDIHWWGSYYWQAPMLMPWSDHYLDPSLANPAMAHATVTGFIVSFFQDVPAGPGSPSHPGAMIGTPQVITQFTISPYPIAVIDRNMNQQIDERDEAVWQYNARLPEPFEQFGTEGQPVIYWLSIVAVNAAQAGHPPIQWGWHESYQHNLDAAVQVGPVAWGDDYPNGHSMAVKDMAFELAVPEPATMALLGSGLALMAMARRGRRAGK